jgi:hypothetical protein
MVYSDFKLETAISAFNLTLVEQSGLFFSSTDVEPSAYLHTTLAQNLDLAVAINTEKARSELIIAPMLLEVKRRFQDRLSLFSGIDFSVAPEKGLTGMCDFLISRSKEQSLVRAPVVAIVEAKNENLKAGLGQCIAELVAAQIFNRQQKNNLPVLYGVITIGRLWKFLKLEGQTISLDLSEYFIGNPGKILGILCDIATAG